MFLRQNQKNIIQQKHRLMIKTERFSQDSDLGMIRDMLRPLLKNGFEGLILKKAEKESEILKRISYSALARTSYILGGQLVYRDNSDWLINHECSVRLEKTKIRDSAWIVVLLYTMIINQITAELVVEKPYLGLTENQQKMLSELFVLYESIGGCVFISGDESCYFNLNYAEELEQLVER